MTNSTPNRVTEIEEVKDWIETALDADAHGMWVRAPKFQVIQDVAELLAPRFVDKLTTLVAEAEARGRQMALEKALELVEKNDPNVEMGRMTNPHYWGNCLRRELQAALTNHTV